MTVFGGLKRPGAWLPLAMSVAALAVVLGHLMLVGVGAARDGDEGAAAHVFQLLIAGQLPVVAWFAIRWLPRAPRLALPVLASQGLALMAALAPVYLLKL
jgi:hypothetical protein